GSEVNDESSVRWQQPVDGGRGRRWPQAVVLIGDRAERHGSLRPHLPPPVARSTPAASSSSISASVNPASASTSRLCWPGSGAGRRTFTGVAENLVGEGIILYFPIGCSASGSASMISSRLAAGAAGIPCSAQNASQCPVVLVASALASVS